MRCIVHYPNQSTYSKSKPLSETNVLLIYWLFSYQSRMTDRSHLLIAYYTYGSISRKMSKLSDKKSKNKYGKIKKKKATTYTRPLRKTLQKIPFLNGVSTVSNRQKIQKNYGKCVVLVFTSLLVRHKFCDRRNSSRM